SWRAQISSFELLRSPTRCVYAEKLKVCWPSILVGRRKRGGQGARHRTKTFPRPFASGMEFVRVVDGYTLWQ
ncbi:unnamed protein product, partial [Ectocarpus sp. 12 AP-2014]